MADRVITNKSIITLDSNIPDLSHIEDSLNTQAIKLEDQLLTAQKVLQQAKILNIYKAHENDFIADETIFDSGDDV